VGDVGGFSEQREEEQGWRERKVFGGVQGEGALLVGFRSEGANLKELRVGFNCGTLLEKIRGNDRRSRVKDVGERGGDRYRSSEKPGSGAGGQRTGQVLWGFAFGA